MLLLSLLAALWLAGLGEQLDVLGPTKHPCHMSRLCNHASLAHFEPYRAGTGCRMALWPQAHLDASSCP